MSITRRAQARAHQGIRHQRPTTPARREVQVAVLTERIKNLTEHLQTHEKDYPFPPRPAGHGRPAPPAARLSQDKHNAGAIKKSSIALVCAASQDQTKHENARVLPARATSLCFHTDDRSRPGRRDRRSAGPTQEAARGIRAAAASFAGPANPFRPLPERTTRLCSLFIARKSSGAAARLILETGKIARQAEAPCSPPTATPSCSAPPSAAKLAEAGHRFLPAHRQLPGEDLRRRQDSRRLLQARRPARARRRC